MNSRDWRSWLQSQSPGLCSCSLQPHLEQRLFVVLAIGMIRIYKGIAALLFENINVIIIPILYFCHS